uniref:Uncharacterized protein n=1 Tax=Rhizophora mucronata TaxID=61149 RepID=A0A2P2PK37_RHIMU
MLRVENLYHIQVATSTICLPSLPLHLNLHYTKAVNLKYSTRKPTLYKWLNLWSHRQLHQITV